MNIAASTQLVSEPRMDRFKKEPRIKAGGQGSGRKPGFSHMMSVKTKAGDYHSTYQGNKSGMYVHVREPESGSKIGITHSAQRHPSSDLEQSFTRPDAQNHLADLGIKHQFHG